MTLYRHEMNLNKKSLLIWTLCISMMCFGCILLYTSLKDSIEGIADSYSNMGAMSAALGMDKMSIATLRGYYATEIAMIHGLLCAMFAAMSGTGMLSREEAGHTSEFLNTLPLGRGGIVIPKYLALICNILILNLICSGIYLAGFWLIGEDIGAKEFFLFHAASLLMQIEIGTVCFLISSFTKKNLFGAGIGVSLILFTLDIMCRIIPAIENLKYATPFYYANASDIFVNGKTNNGMLILGAAITLVSFAVAWIRYRTKDLTA